MEQRQPYPSDMTDEEWAILDSLVPAAKIGGRLRQYELREVVMRFAI